VHPSETCRIGVLPNGDDSFERNFEYFLKIKKSRGIFNTNIYWEATRKVLDNTTKVDMNHITDERLNENVRELADMFYENDLDFSKQITLEDTQAFTESADAVYQLQKEFGIFIQAEKGALL
jgi:hypothetical protein